jgi:hypothetical protein
LTGAASFAAARVAGAARISSALAAVSFLAMPTVLWDAEVGGPDAIGLAAVLTGLVFLIRLTRTGRGSDLVLAGVGLGLAAGSRWYYSSAVAVLVVVWALVTLISGFPLAEWQSRAGQRVRSAGGLLIVVLATSGFWLLRNWVQADDPFYPVRIQIAGTTIWNAPHDVYRAISGFSIADYLGNSSILSHYIVPAFRKALSLAGLLVVAAAAAGGVSSFSRTRQKDRQSATVLLLVTTSLLLAIVYVFTPYSAFGPKNRPSLTWVNVRYALPALGVAVPAAAVAATWWPRWARTMLALGVLVAAILGIHQADSVLGTTHADLAGGVAIVLAAVVAAGLARRRSATRGVMPGSRRRVLAMAALPVIAVVVAGGYALQHRLNASRYAAYDPTSAWVQHHPAPLRVGLAGSFNFQGVSPAWAMYGTRIQNSVAFVGRLKGGYLTQYTSRAQWLRAVRRGRFDVLEIFTGHSPYPTTDNEVVWAEQAHFPVITRSSRFELVNVGTAPRVSGAGGG